MKPTIKAGVRKKSYYTHIEFENTDEIDTLVKEAKSQLDSCVHCGFAKPTIRYEYWLEPEHERYIFYVWCFGLEKIDELMSNQLGCNIQSFVPGATDEKSVRETLDRLVKVWNRRPDDKPKEKQND